MPHIQLKAEHFNHELFKNDLVNLLLIKILGLKLSVEKFRVEMFCNQIIGTYHSESFMVGVWGLRKHLMKHHGIEIVAYNFTASGK